METQKKSIYVSMHMDALFYMLLTFLFNNTPKNRVYWK